MGDSEPNHTDALRAKYPPEKRRGLARLSAAPLVEAFQQALPSIDLTHATRAAFETRLEIEKSVGLDGIQLATVRNVEDLESLLEGAVEHHKYLQQELPEVTAAKKILEAVIAAANAQIPSHQPISWTALEEKGRSR